MMEWWCLTSTKKRWPETILSISRHQSDTIIPKQCRQAVLARWSILSLYYCCNILNAQLQDRWIDRREPIKWQLVHQTYCDLFTRLRVTIGNWLWSYLRRNVYSNDTMYNSVGELYNKSGRDEISSTELFSSFIKKFWKKILGLSRQQRRVGYLKSDFCWNQMNLDEHG